MYSSDEMYLLNLNCSLFSNSDSAYSYEVKNLNLMFHVRFVTILTEDDISILEPKSSFVFLSTMLVALWIVGSSSPIYRNL